MNPQAPIDSYAVRTRIPGALGHPVQLLQGSLRQWCCCVSRFLGPERFDWAFRKYIRDWAFKHPAPSDFFPRDG